MLVIIKKVKLRYFCSLALRFFDHMVVARASFFSTQLDKPQNFAFALSKSFGMLSSLLSPHPPWQTQDSLFLFHIKPWLTVLSSANLRFLLLLFLNPLAFRQAYFLRTQLGKHQNFLLLFRRLMFSTLAFSHRT